MRGRGRIPSNVHELIHLLPSGLHPPQYSSIILLHTNSSTLGRLNRIKLQLVYENRIRGIVGCLSKGFEIVVGDSRDCRMRECLEDNTSLLALATSALLLVVLLCGRCGVEYG